jgi:HK97 family phage portal protein
VTSLVRALVGPVIEGEIVRTAGGVTNKLPVPVVATSQRYAFLDSTGSSADGGDKEAQAGAMTANGTLFAIVGGISFDVSAVQWKLWRKAASGKVEDRTEVTSHPSIDLFDQPNPFMNGQEFFEVVQQHQELTGEGWSLTSYLLGLPFELWPVYPHRMLPVPHPTDFLNGYLYLSPDGQKIPLGVKEVSLLRQPHPLNLFRGLSAVQAISADLSAGRAASLWNDRFFRNSAIPGGIIEQDMEASGLSDDEFARFTQHWREAHQGVDNAHRVAVLEQGMKWVSNSYSLKDLQFTELRGMSRDVVREAYRYPISKLGTVEDVNRANGEAQEARYANDILKPRLVRWRAWRNRKILPLFGGDWRSLEWDFVDPAPDDTEKAAALLTARSTAWKIFVDGGVDGKAAVEALDLPPELGAAWTKPEPPPAPTLPGAKPPAKKPAALWTPPDWTAGADAWPVFTNEADASPPGLDELGAQWETALDQAVADWQAEVSPAQRAACAQAVDKAVDSGDLAGLAAIPVPVLGVELLTSAMQTMSGAGAAAVVTEALAFGVSGIARGLADAAALGVAAEATAGLLAQGMANAAGREALRLAQPGVSGGDVADGVTAYLDNLTDRALRDAIGGALTRAQNAGRLATYAVNSAASHGWQYTLWASEHLDGNTCGPCREIDGSRLPTVEAAQLAYGGAGYLFCEGGVRCRGTMIGHWERITGDEADDGA